MNVTALGIFGFVSVITTCWGEQLQRPTRIGFPLRPFSLTFVNLTAIGFKTYQSIWAPMQGFVCLPLWGGLGDTYRTVADARYWKRDVKTSVRDVKLLEVSFLYFSQAAHSAFLSC